MFNCCAGMKKILYFSQETDVVSAEPNLYHQNKETKLPKLQNSESCKQQVAIFCKTIS
jgi:hypothetical protein